MMRFRELLESAPMPKGTRVIINPDSPKEKKGKIMGWRKSEEIIEPGSGARAWTIVYDVRLDGGGTVQYAGEQLVREK